MQLLYGSNGPYICPIILKSHTGSFGEGLFWKHFRLMVLRAMKISSCGINDICRKK